MKWRPEGLVNPYPIEIIGPIPEKASPTAFTAWEACADAFVEALRKSGYHIEKGVYLAQQGGTWVFIPDTEDI